MKDISVPDPKAQIWGNLLRGLCSLDRGAPLPRIHLFLYSERKQHISINGTLTQMISLQPKSQSPKTALLQNHCVTVMVGTYVSTKASWFVGWGVFWEVTESWVCDTHCWISTGFTPGCDTGRQSLVERGGSMWHGLVGLLSWCCELSPLPGHPALEPADCTETPPTEPNKPFLP